MAVPKVVWKVALKAVQMDGMKVEPKAALSAGTTAALKVDRWAGHWAAWKAGQWAEWKE